MENSHTHSHSHSLRNEYAHPSVRTVSSTGKQKQTYTHARARAPVRPLEVSEGKKREKKTQLFFIEVNLKIWTEYIEMSTRQCQPTMRAKNFVIERDCFFLSNSLNQTVQVSFVSCFFSSFISKIEQNQFSRLLVFESHRMQTIKNQSFRGYGMTFLSLSLTLAVCFFLCAWKNCGMKTLI